MFRMIWAVVRTIVIPAALIWFVFDLYCAWYFKLFLVLFIVNSVINDYRIGYWRNELKARTYTRRW